MLDTAAVCRQCGRTIKTYTSRFGDLLYRRHKMAVLSDYNPIRRTPKELGAAPAKAGVDSVASNPDATALWEVDCPMSGQVVEDPK